MRFVSALSSLLVASSFLIDAVNGIVVGSPTLDGTYKYQHLIVVTVPLPANVTAASVWSDPTLTPYLANSTVYTNWTSSTAVNNATTNVIAGFASKTPQTIYSIYSDNATDTSSLLINQLPGLSATQAVTLLGHPLGEYPISQLATDTQNGRLPQVAFYNSSAVNVTTLGSFVAAAQPLFTGSNVTALFVFVPTSNATIVQTPNFITGYGVPAGNDTVPHTQSDVANSLATQYLGKAPSTLAHQSLKKLFGRYKRNE